MNNCGATKRTTSAAFERCTCSECARDYASDHAGAAAVETTTLLQGEESSKPTPLPKKQVAALLLVFLPESVTSTLIYPFIVQVSRKDVARRR
jgi:hypothetical protein